MKSLLKVQTWPDWDPLGGLGIDDITDAGVATALAFLGIFLWLAPRAPWAASARSARPCRPAWAGSTPPVRRRPL